MNNKSDYRMKGLTVMSQLTIAIIGASFAGISSALTLKRLNPSAKVILIDREDQLGFIPSSINMVLKGRIKQINDKMMVNKESLVAAGIELLLGHEVVDIDTENRQLAVHYQEKTDTIHFNKLILAMGARQTSERIIGANHPRVLTTKSWAASLDSQAKLEESKHILIVGGGQVGLEAADAYHSAGKKLTIVEAFESLAFKYYDPEMVEELEKRIINRGITIYKNQQVEAIKEEKGSLITFTTQQQALLSDHVVLAINFRPNSQLIEEKLETHLDRTIVVDDYLQTSADHIYAVGDLIRVPYAGTNRDYYLPFVNNAIMTGRLAAMNALGMNEKMTDVVRIVGSQLFGLFMASVGLTEEEAKLYHNIRTTIYQQADTNQVPVTIKLIVKKESGQLLGAQLYSETDILPLADTIAIAIKAAMTDRDLAFQDCLYYSMVSVINPVLYAAAFSCYEKRVKEVNEDAARGSI